MTAYNVINPGSMQSGQPEDVSQVLANFNQLATILNGNLDFANLSPAAGILATQLAGGIPISKLLGFPNDPTYFPAGDGTWKKLTLGGLPVANTVAALNTLVGTPQDGQMAKIRLMPATYNVNSVALPIGTITVGDTSELPTAGGVITGPNGDITFTGVTATTLTGCTGGSGTMPVGAPLVLKTGTPRDNSYETVVVVYDANIGKWVSVSISQGAGFYGQGSANFAASWTEGFTVANAQAYMPAYKWRAYDAAGLKPQVKFQGTITTTVAATAQISPSFIGSNFSGASGIQFGGDDTAASGIATVAANALLPIESLWGNIPGGYSLRDFIIPSCRGISNTGGPASIYYGRNMAMLRWVG